MLLKPARSRSSSQETPRCALTFSTARRGFLKSKVENEKTFPALAHVNPTLKKGRTCYDEDKERGIGSAGLLRLRQQHLSVIGVLSGNTT